MAVTAVDADGGDGRWALIGRGAELRAARAGLAGAGTVVCGSWGLGCSAFARAVVARPWARRVLASSASAPPLFVARSLLDEADDTTDANQVARRLREALARATSRPVLVVEGWDHVDGASAAIVLHLVAEGDLRLVAVREDTAPVSAAADWQRVGLARVDLLPLAAEDLAEVLGHLLDGPVEGRTRQELLGLASGNPGLLAEVVGASVAAASLRRESGLWRLVGEPVLSPMVADLARAALDQLDPSGRAVAELLSVSGPLPSAVIARVADPAGVEVLERAGLATAVVGDEPASVTVSLSDPIVAAHLGPAVPATTRLRIAAALAAATESLPLADEPDLFVRSAEWALAAGQEVEPQRLLRAARTAIDLGDPSRAERLAAASAAREASTEAVLLESWCADECGAIDRSERVLADHRPQGDEAVAAVAIRRSEQRFWTHRDPTGATAVLAAATARLTAPWDAAIVAQAAMFDLIDGRSDRALAAALPLAGHGTRLVSGTASLAAALALVMDDRPVEAAAVAEEALAGLQGSDPGLAIDPGVHIISLCFSYDGQGRWHEADELTEAVYRYALNRPGRQAQGWAALVRARVLSAQGRPADAVAVGLEAEHIWRSAKLDGVARWSATVAGQAAAAAGDLAAVTDCLDRIEAVDPGPFQLFEPEVERLRAWYACLLDVSGPSGAGAAAARSRLAAAARSASADGRRHLASLAAFDLVRLGDPACGASLLAALVEGGASATTGRRSATAAAVLAGDADELESLAATWEAAGAAATAAECLAFAAAAAPVRASALGPRIERLTAGTGLRTPPLRTAAALVETQQLTAREREIVALVSDGLSNRAIAEQLVVSTRTVENHLHRAYAKLGVSSRAELVAAPRA